MKTKDEKPVWFFALEIFLSWSLFSFLAHIQHLLHSQLCYHTSILCFLTEKEKKASVTIQPFLSGSLKGHFSCPTGAAEDSRLFTCWSCRCCFYKIKCLSNGNVSKKEMERVCTAPSKNDIILRGIKKKKNTQGGSGTTSFQCKAGFCWAENTNWLLSQVKCHCLKERVNYCLKEPPCWGKKKKRFQTMCWGVSVIRKREGKAACVSREHTGNTGSCGHISHQRVAKGR